MSRCKLCNKKLNSRNKSGYCHICFPKSPQSHVYQAQFQRKWYQETENKNKKKRYFNKPKIKAKTKKYQRKYQKENIEVIRVQKREWARKRRELNKQKHL